MLGLGLNFGSSQSGSSAARMGGPALLLDTYTGAAAAYSLRKLKSDYTGKVLQVRRASDHVEVDVGFDSNGLLSLDSPVTNVTEESTGITQGSSTNAAKLGEFCGEARRSGGDTSYATVDSMTEAAHIEVVTWYDQSGNTRNATTTTAAGQPRIYDRTTGVMLENGKPTISAYDGGTVRGLGATVSSDLLHTNNEFSQVAVFEAASNGHVYLNKFTDTFPHWRVRSGGSTNSAAATPTVLTGGTNSFVQTLGFLSRSGNTVQSYENNVLAINGTDTASISTYNASVGIGRVRYGGNVQELIFWNSDQSDYRTDIESNINTFYSIY